MTPDSSFPIKTIGFSFLIEKNRKSSLKGQLSKLSGIISKALKIPCGKPQGILMQGIIFYHIRSLDPAVNRREYARYPFNKPKQRLIRELFWGYRHRRM